MLGIYIHIPFCKGKCGYCDFCSTTQYNEKLQNDYQKTLLSQIGEFFDDGKKDVDTIYIGGGTPSVYGGKRLRNIIKELRKRTNVLQSAEITVEANPESCSKEFLKELKKAGVNRISLGVQSTNDGELAQIGRLHNFAQAKEAVELCKKYLTNNISLDLIYGLPSQSMESWEQSLLDIIALEPAHISMYGLKLEIGSKMYGMDLDLPDDDMQADMYLKGVEILKENRYDQYEISNFARSNQISRHNSKYWDLSEYLGLGASAHSLYGGRRFAFENNIEEYCKGNIKLSEIEDLPLDKSYRKGEYIMLMLRTSKGLEETKFYDIFKEDLSFIEKKAKKYVDNGYGIFDHQGFRLTAKGFLISNTIICDFLE